MATAVSGERTGRRGEPRREVIPIENVAPDGRNTTKESQRSADALMITRQVFLWRLGLRWNGGYGRRN